MIFLLICAIQVTVILSIALASLPLLRRRSAALRHLVLSTAIIFSILTPAFNLVVPLWSVSTVVSRNPVVAPIREQISAITSSAPDATADDATPAHPSDTVTADRRSTPTLLTLWMTGVFVGSVMLLTGLVRLARVVSASIPVPNGAWRRLAALISTEYGLRSRVYLLESRNPSILVTWGAIRPRVILPAGSLEWTEERASIVLRHELAHIRRGDWIIQMLTQALRIVYWFNPLVWIACRRLRLESECACDDTVLSREIEGHVYAEHLLDLARLLNRPGHSWSAALSMARPSTVERRFSAMLNPGLNRHPLTRFASCFLVLVGLGVTLSLSAASSTTPPAATPLPATPVHTISEQPAPALAEFVAPGPILAPKPRQNPAFGGPAQVRRGAASRALDRALLEAAEDGDISQIDELLRAGADVNAVINGDGTPLIAAADKGHFEVVRYLLDRGAGPNVPADGDGNPLIVAAKKGRAEVVQLLLDRGADPNAAVLGDGNPLIAAASKGKADIVTLLLDRGARIEDIVPGDENALIQASEQGQLDTVRLLVNRRADVNVRVWVEANQWRPNGEWRTALSMARRGGHNDVVQFLLSVGARE